MLGSTVRVVPVRFVSWPAWLVGAAGGLSLLWFCNTHSPTDPHALVLAGAFGATWMFGQLLPWRPRPYLGRVRKEVGGLQIGRTRIPATGVTAAIAAGALGASVVFTWSNGALIVETATLADARTLVALSEASLDGEPMLRVPRRVLRALKLTSASLGLFCCFILAVANYKAEMFGGVVGWGAITTLLFFLEAVFLRKVTFSSEKGLADAQGSIREHVLLHFQGSMSEAERTRVRVLVRSGEPMREWLARIDGIASDAYRGELPPKEELEQALQDPTSELHERLGAARLLVRRYGMPLEELERLIDPALTPYFFEVDHDDVDRVTSNVERLGPVFRP